MIKFGIFSYHPAPYRDGTFSEFHRNYKDNIEMKVYYFLNIDSGHQYQKITELDFPHHYLEKKSFFNLLWHKETKKILKKEQFDVILIPGYSEFTTLYLIAYAILKKIKIILSIDNIHDHRDKRMKKLMKSLITRFLVKFLYSAYVPGIATKNYLIDYNMNPSRIYEGSYNLDLE